MVRLRGKVKRNALLLVSRKVGSAGAQFFMEGTKVSTRQLFRFYLFSCSLICQNSLNGSLGVSTSVSQNALVALACHDA